MADFTNAKITKDVSFEEDSHDVNADDGAVVGTGFANVVGATGFKSVANQGGDVNQAEDGSQVVSKSLIGQNQNNSDGAVQAGRDASGINTGVNTGVNAGGDASDNVIGDFNRTANVDGDAQGAAFSFGTGDSNSAFGNSIAGDGALAVGGDASNVSHVIADRGSAVSADDAQGSNVELTETNVVSSDNTQVVGDEALGLAGQAQFDESIDIDDSVFLED